MKSTNSLDVRCAVHDVYLGQYLNCPECLAESKMSLEELHRKLFADHRRGTVISSPPSARPSAVKVDGQIVPVHHGTAYIEWDEVPAALEDEINEYIERRIQQWRESCSCLSCQEYRQKATNA